MPKFAKKSFVMMSSLIVAMTRWMEVIDLDRVAEGSIQLELLLQGDSGG